MVKVVYNIFVLGGIMLMKRHHLIFTLFGATGDLAFRKIYPALYRLYKYNYLSKRFAVVGTGRREWSQEYFRSVILDSIDNEIDDLEHAIEFTQHFYYQSHNVKHYEEYEQLKQVIEELDDKYKTQGNRLFYISLSPELFPDITRYLHESGISETNGYSKLIIEKPFGHDFETAQNLQNELAKYFREEQIYRIDHYLGKSILNSFLHFRFSNHIFKALWNKEHIRQVQITLAEEVGVEDRAAYYEQSGVSRDMLQNHIMQLISLIAMRQPDTNQQDLIRQEKINVVKHINFYPDKDTFKESVVRGQYGPDINNYVKGYRQEDNVAKDSITETYFAGVISLDMEEWQGVPFFVRSGKRLHEKLSVIHIEFQPSHESLKGNRLTIEISPKMSFNLYLNYQSLGYETNNQVICLDSNSCEPANNIPHDYELLILEALNGNLNSFSHWEEVAYAWKFVDHIRQYWQDESVNFPNYASYSNGPTEADQLLMRKGFKWFD